MFFCANISAVAKKPRHRLKDIYETYVQMVWGKRLYSP